MTVWRQGAPAGMDLELPADMAVARLVEMLARALEREDSIRERPYEVEAHPPGRLLRPEETLGEAGVWDGAWLFLR